MVVETLPLTIVGIIILVAIALSVGAKKIGLNPVLGYILAGFLLGPFFLSFLHPEDPLIMGFGEMGLFVLLFYLGLELSLKDFLKAGAASFGLALIDMALSAGLGFLIMISLGFSPIFSIIVGFMLFSTSTAVVAKFAIDRNLLKNHATQLAISILILQDFLGILLLVFITSMNAPGNSGLSLAFTALIFAVTAFFAVHTLSQRVGKWLIEHGYGHTEVTLYALGIGLLVATVGVFLGLSAALGAYFAGFALAETPSGEKIKKDVNFMRDFFLVFFFVAFGTTIFYNFSLGAIALPQFGDLLLLGGLALALVIVGFIAHLLSTVLFGQKFGLSKEDAPMAAVLLLPLGEFVVIIATVSSKVLQGNESGFVSIIAFLLIAISVIIFQPMFDHLPIIRRFSNKLPQVFKMKPAQTIIKAHTSYTKILLKKVALNGFVVICFALMTVMLYEQLPTFGVPVPYGRQFTAMIVFAFFAFVPFMTMAKALEKLFGIAARDVAREVKRFGRKKWAYSSAPRK